MKIVKLKDGEKVLLDGRIMIIYRKRCKPRVIESKSQKEAKILLREYIKLK